MLNKRSAAMTLLIATGCGGQRPDFDLGQDTCNLQTSQVKQAAYVDTKQAWANKKVSVCWINPSPENKEYREWSRQSVFDNWDIHIALDFEWKDDPCNGCEDVRILISDENPYAVWGMDKSVKGVAVPTVILNFDFVEWNPECRNSDLMFRACIETIAAHEFGHVLGFIHEQNRPDTPKDCIGSLEDSSFDGITGDLMSGMWDKNSIMNYCSRVTKTSATDIMMAQRLYGIQ